MSKKYKVTANAVLAADGYVKAGNKKAAVEKYTEFIRDQLRGLSSIDIEIIEIFDENDVNYNPDYEPGDRGWNNDCYTESYLS